MTTHGHRGDAIYYLSSVHAQCCGVYRLHFRVTSSSVNSGIVVYAMTSVRLACQPARWIASQPSVCMRQNIAIFLDTSMSMVNVKLCMIVVLTVFYQFIPLSVTLVLFQGHSSVK